MERNDRIWTLTRSMGADNTPYFESGAKISHTFENEKWFVSALILNGWQHIKPVDGNTMPSFGIQITYKLSPGLNYHLLKVGGLAQLGSRRLKSSNRTKLNADESTHLKSKSPSKDGSFNQIY